MDHSLLAADVAQNERRPPATAAALAVRVAKRDAATINDPPGTRDNILEAIWGSGRLPLRTSGKPCSSLDCLVARAVASLGTQTFVEIPVSDVIPIPTI